MENPERRGPPQHKEGCQGSGQAAAGKRGDRIGSRGAGAAGKTRRGAFPLLRSRSRRGVTSERGRGGRGHLFGSVLWAVGRRVRPPARHGPPHGCAIGGGGGGTGTGSTHWAGRERLGAGFWAGAGSHRPGCTSTPKNPTTSCPTPSFFPPQTGFQRGVEGASSFPKAPGSPALLVPRR